MLTPKAIRLIRRVQKHLLADPRRYDQTMDITHSTKAPCGTAACIGGWTYLLGHKIPPSKWKNIKTCGLYDDVGGELASAKTLLGLDRATAMDLFASDGSNWPEPYGTQWRKATTPRGRVRVAVRRLEYLIRTGR